MSDFENFDSSLTAGNVKAAMKAAGAVSADLWQVTPSQLRVLDGFESRPLRQKHWVVAKW